MIVRPLTHAWMADNSTLPCWSKQRADVLIETFSEDRLAYSIESKMAYDFSDVNILRFYIFVNYFWHQTNTKVFGNMERARSAAEEYMDTPPAWLLLQTSQTFPLPFRIRERLGQNKVFQNRNRDIEEMIANLI